MNIFNPFIPLDVSSISPRTPMARIKGNAPIIGKGNPAQGPLYSGLETFIYKAPNAIARADDNAVAQFIADGWTNGKSEISTFAGYASGYTYTEEAANISANPLISVTPSGRSRCLAMEPLCYTLQSQTDFYLGYGNSQWAIPPHVFYQMWIYRKPDTGDTRVYASEDAALNRAANYVSANTITITQTGDKAFVFDPNARGGSIPITLIQNGVPVYTTISVYAYDGPSDTITLTLSDAVADATLTHLRVSHCYWSATYVDSTTLDLIVPDDGQFAVGNAVKIYYSNNTTQTSTVSSRPGSARVVIADAILDATITHVEYQTWRSGYNGSKFLYHSHNGVYGTNCGNGGAAYIIDLDNFVSTGGDTPPNPNSPVTPSVAGTLSIRPDTGVACNNTSNVTDSVGNNWAGPNLGTNKYPIVAGTWSLVRIEVDHSAEHMTYRLWVRYYGESNFTLVAEWISNSTVNDGVTAILRHPFWDGTGVDGNFALRLITTVGGTNTYKGNWFDTVLYIDDFCIADAASKLPIYYDAA